MPYQQWIDPDPKFLPARKNIDSITNANPALVTTTTAHGYTTGMIVRLVIPPAKGMQEANQLTGTITVTGANTFTIDIDTSLFEAFVAVPPAGISQLIDICAQVNPVGESNDTLSAAARDKLS
jgi:hypothetical protein